MHSFYRIVVPDASVLEHVPVAVSARFVDQGGVPYIECQCTEQDSSLLHAWCSERELDIGAVMPFSSADVALIAMDMDSTLITIECIDEIADFIGKKDEVAHITESAMRGEILFTQSLAARVKLLAGLPVSALEAVYQQRVQLSQGAEAMIRTFQSQGIRFMLVSGGFTFFTDRLKARLDFDEAYANVLEIKDGVLTGHVVGDILDGAAKAAHIARACLALKQTGADRQRIIAVGDGSNDRLMFAEADAGVAYRAKPVLEEVASHRIRYGGLDTMLAYFAA